MDVTSGYRQTEVGTVPEDWEVMPFVSAVGTYIDYRGRTPRKLGLSWGGGEILALSANNVQMGRIDPNKEAYFGSDELYRRWMAHGDCQRGDVLLTMEAPLGNVAQIPDSKKYILSQRVLLIKPKEWLLRDFLAHYMRGSSFQAQLSQNSTGSTAKGIQRKKLDELPIAVPRNPVEQSVIAEALSDADALIESLEQLLTKKRQVKQGAMQELLTGKQRLPGFSGDWVANRLGSICDIAMGRTPSRLDAASWGTGYKWLSIADLKSKVVSESKEEITPFAAASMQVIRKGTLLMSFKLSIGRLCFAGCDLYTNEAICSFNNLKANAGFLYYILGRTDFSLYGKQAVKGYTLNKESLQSVEVRLPPIEEQTAIATLLSDMDTELAALEAKLTKARQLKQGMMQELLTGRIRLVHGATGSDQ